MPSSPTTLTTDEQGVILRATVGNVPRDPMLHANLARAYCKLAQNEDSQRELDRAKAFAPNEAGHWDSVVKAN